MDKIEVFEKTIRQDDLVFYYSGHCRHANGQNYLVPVDDARIDSDENIPDFGMDLSRVVERLCSKNVNNVSLYMLDCYKPYLLKDEPPSEAIRKRPKAMKALPRTFIQYACAPNQQDSVVPHRDRNDLYTKHLLNIITHENIQIADLFKRISQGVHRESNQKQKPLSMNGLGGYEQKVVNFVDYNGMINAYSDRIRDLKLELEKYTVQTSMGSNSADLFHANRIRALIHEFTQKRGSLISKCYAAAPRG
ncbi:unnamed protein product [Adineta ricciae]|uniref:Peptidase C14 caspase domain-containing protein n=1 Tax=Adineta ricciae TaxID=249248 RepID=A0A814RTV2_ADIRI|nr:unnamed protein product [Adineta ricciae]CAF1137320.1 unnamed protein product [Adineta ricciae]